MTGGTISHGWRVDIDRSTVEVASQCDAFVLARIMRPQCHFTTRYDLNDSDREAFRERVSNATLTSIIDVWSYDGDIIGFIQEFVRDSIPADFEPAEPHSCSPTECPHTDCDVWHRLRQKPG